ncbi:MAG: 2-hydroxychromene-2-carboxylate isomerase [Betaproteobacteria bacterium]|nr:2-hydroxychromene-2-carboxylate isomerase [Betaproteobacteria bacterium]
MLCRIAYVWGYPPAVPPWTFPLRSSGAAPASIHSSHCSTPCPPNLSSTGYFDVISPFSYFQHERLNEVEAVADVRRVPVLFAGLLQHWGQLGPAEIAPKRRFTFRYAVWYADRMGIPFRLPPGHPFNPIRLLRLMVAFDGRADVVSRVFRFVWAEGRTSDDPEAWRALCTELGVADGDEFIGRQTVKDGLRMNGERALSRNVFGVPTFVAPDGESFWGVDATDMLLDHLSGAPVMGSAEMARVDALPVAKSRLTPG